MEIQIRERCPHCDNGFFYSDEWREWSKGWNAWRENVTEDQFNDPKHQYPVPMPSGPEEYPCSDCEGTQVVYRWAAIDTVLKAVEMAPEPKFCAHSRPISEPCREC